MLSAISTTGTNRSSLEEQVKIKLRSPFDGRRNFQGLLRGVEEQDVVVQVDDHEYLLPIDLIDKANIIPRFD